MTLRKIDLMHREFGFSPGNKCKTCDNLIVQQANRRYYKCEVYGATDSEASDWRLSYDACGMYNKEYDGGDMIRLVRPDKAPDTPIVGQMALTDNPYIFAEYFVPTKEELENAKTVTNYALPINDNTGGKK